MKSFVYAKSIKILINAFNSEHPFIFVPFTKVNYVSSCILQKYCVLKFYKINNILCIIFKKPNFLVKKHVKFFNLKNINNSYKLADIKLLKNKQHTYFLFTSKGVFSAKNAVNKKCGGNLLCSL